MPQQQNERIVQRTPNTVIQTAAQMQSGAELGAPVVEVQHQQVMQQTHANTVVQADEIGIPQL